MGSGHAPSRGCPPTGSEDTASRSKHMRATIHSFFHYMPRAEGRAVMISVVVGVVMLAVKLVAYERTGSAAILSDALEGIVNIVASCFAAYALSTAHRPADREHPYGHGKIEFLSAAFEGGMIVLAAVVMIGGAVKHAHDIYRHGAALQAIGYGMLLLGVAMAVHGVLGGYLVRTGRREGSITLEADGWHLLSDAVTSAVALGSLAVVRMTGWLYAD